MSTKKIKKNKRKKLIFKIFVLLMMYVAIEIMALLYYGITKDKMFSFSQMQAYRQKVIEDPHFFSYNNNSEKIVHKIDPQSIHPYLGYVRDAAKLEDTSPYGFLGENTPFVKKTKDNLVVGVFGGSFAMGVSRRRETFVTMLKKISQFKDKEIIIQPLTLGGYKQPQQLMTLSYFLSLGVHFDVVINIDGFNEVALPLSDNIPKKIHPLYPRLWFTRFKKSFNSELLKMMTRSQMQLDKRCEWAKTFSGFFTDFNVSLNVIYQIYDEKYHNIWNKMQNDLANYTVSDVKNMEYDVSGPPFDYENKSLLFDTVIENWFNSSLQMNHLCAANHMEYFHFLQPNQYVPGSKKMTEKEKKIAFYRDESHPYCQGVLQGYPLLIEKGKELKARDIPFYDLTRIFVDEDEILYADSCCHLNERGYDLIIEEIVRKMSEKMK